MKDYRVLSPLHHDGEFFAVGETVTLTAKQAAPLVQCGALAFVSDGISGDGSDGSVTLDAVVEAIGQLDPDDATLWTKGGKPQVEALEAVLGQNLSAGRRDTAFAQFAAAPSNASAQDA